VGVTRVRHGVSSSGFSNGDLKTDAHSAGVGRHRLDRNVRPIEIIMACEAGRISIGEWS